MSVNTATKIPAITQIRGLPPLAVMALQAIKETLEVREGLHEPLDRFVSVRELADLILNDKSIVDYLGSGHSHDDRYFTKSQWDLDAKGDLSVAQGLDTPGTLSVGTNNQLIRADSGAALGIEYFSLLGTSNQITVTHNPSDATLSLPQNIHAGASPVFTALTLSNIVAGVADYDKFIVSDGGLLKFRAGAEVLSDIGGAASGHVHALNDLSDVDCSGATDGDVLTYQSGTVKWEDIAPSGGGGATDYAFRTITGITNDVVADLAHDILTLAVGNNKLSILGTAVSDTITFTVNEGNIDHNGLLNTHNLTTNIDHTTITNTHNLTTDIDHNQLTNLTVGDVHTQYLNVARHDLTARHSLGTVVPHDTLNGLTDVDAGTPLNDDVLTYKSGTGKWEPQAGGGGAVSYAFRTITGITNDVVADLAEDTLTLSSANNLLSIVGTTATDTVTFTVNQANLDHGSIGGLGDSADHTWALLVDGSRWLTSTWFANEAITLANNRAFRARDTVNFSRSLAYIDVGNQIIYGDTHLNNLYLRISQNLYFQRWDGGVRTLLQLTTLGAKLENGTEINEFSTDGTLAGDSDSAVPTEKAVKTYVDNTGFKSKARGYRATAQTIPQTTWTKVELDNESFDGLGEFDPVTNYRFVASQAGYYLVFGQVSSADTVADGVRYITRIYKNGAMEISSDKTTGFTTYTAQSISGIVYLAATDYLELWFWHGDAAANIVNASGDTFMTVHRIS